MIKAKAIFQSIINQTETSKGLYEYLCVQRVPIDASDLLRWQWVTAVAALDKYIHDIVRIGMVQEFAGKRTKTDKYNGFKIDLSNYSNITQSQTPEIEFESTINRQLGWMAFQQPDKIADALSFIWSEKNKWDVISQNMSTPISSDDLKKKLKNIVFRRDQIVHEGDCLSSTLPLQQQIINQSDVEEVIQFVTELVDAISVVI